MVLSEGFLFNLKTFIYEKIGFHVCSTVDVRSECFRG